MNSSDLVTVNREILGGTPVFTGTSVPLKTLFDYLEDNYTLEEFLDCFPTVSRDGGAHAGTLPASRPPFRRVRILLDECVPWPLHKSLVGGHEFSTAQR